MPTTEKAISTAIVKWLRRNGYFAVKIPNVGMVSRVGLPDIFFGKGNVWGFFEVKRPGKDARPIQRHVLSQIEQAGGRACVVHSVDEAKEFLNHKE